MKSFFNRNKHSFDVNEREKLVDILYQCHKTCILNAKKASGASCTWNLVESMAVIDALTKMILKDTPSWLTVLEASIPIFDDCAQACAADGCMECAGACESVSNTFSRFLKTGTVPSMLYGKVSKGVGVIKSYGKKSSYTSQSESSDNSDSETEQEDFQGKWASQVPSGKKSWRSRFSSHH